ncbi:MAG TPA: PKD domain-containing protein [Bacteroidia bacterium]|nr:PKD domain-containing protein [Bacteroidia bacterium]
MKKITKKILGIAVLCLGLNQAIVAQCHASFTYTTGSSGLVNFTNTSTGAVGSTVYHWNFTDGSNSSVASPSHTFLYNGTYLANLSMWDTTGNCFDSTSQTITITNGLTCNIAASFSYSVGSGGQINFTNTSTNAPSNANYGWNFGDGSSSNQASPSHTYFYNGTYTVSLYVSDSAGFCQNSTGQVITITNGNTCNINVNYTYTLGTNGQAFFTNTTTGADTNALINWNFGDGFSSQLSPTHTFQYNGTYYVNLQMGDSLSPCYGNHTDTIVITNATNAPVCGTYFVDSTQIAGTMNFINQSWGTSGTTIYSWSFGDGSTSNVASPSHTYAYNGLYSVTLSISDSANSCSSSYTDTVNITTAGPAPCVASVSFNMHQDSLNPQPGVWEAGTYYSSQVTSAIWSWGDGSSSTGLYPTHTYTAAGHYNICVTAIASCGDSSTVCQNDSLFRTNASSSIISVTVVNASTTGIKTNTKENTQISIYPNPSLGVFTLSLTNVTAGAEKAQINITNILGDVVYSSTEQVSNNTVTKQFDLQNMANGAYFIKVNMGNQISTSKIIINK